MLQVEAVAFEFANQTWGGFGVLLKGKWLLCRTELVPYGRSNAEVLRLYTAESTEEEVVATLADMTLLPDEPGSARSEPALSSIDEGDGVLLVGQGGVAQMKVDPQLTTVRQELSRGDDQIVLAFQGCTFSVASGRYSLGLLLACDIYGLPILQQRFIDLLT